MPAAETSRSKKSPVPSSPLTPFVAASPKRTEFSVKVRPPVKLPEVEGLLAGAVSVDITPPPGMPKAGYSANAHIGNGFHTRIRAEITHLRAGRSSLALVQLDLLGGSSVLQHLVADAIAERTDIPLAGVWIGATHTHAAPGQFLGTDFYNQHASNRPGFDPAWTDFLVQRIAAGVIEAYETRVPARAALGSTPVWGLTRNRSHDPYVHNSTVTDKRRDPQRKWVAVNPELNMLRVDRVADDGTTTPLAAAIVFAIHGTGISQKAREYSADVWAYIKGELAQRITASTGSVAVVGAMEGTHADVAPALRPGLAGHREARRIGTGIGAEAHDLYQRLGDELTDQLHLDVGLREVDLDQSLRIDDIELPNRPAVGAALVAGATENLTPVINRIPPFKPGIPKPWGIDNAQGVKWVLGSRWLQPLILPLRGFPRLLAIQVLRIGAALVGLPFEVTVESGRRIGEAAHEAAAAAGLDRVIVSSVANEYCGYVATAEEYSRQFYEGGHTLYGPKTQAFLAAHARQVVAATVDHDVVAEVGAQRHWSLSARRYLAAAPTEPSPERVFDGRAKFSDPTATVDGLWEQSWVDVAPGGLAWHEPLVRVESSDDDGATWAPAQDHGRAVDDQGWSLAITHIGDAGEVAKGAHRYRVRWFDPVHQGGRRHRFVLVANNGRPEVAGQPFD